MAADTTPDPDGPVADTLNAAAKVCRETEVLPPAIAGYLAPQFERWATAPAYRSMTPQSTVVKAARAVLELQETAKLCLEWDDTHEGFTIISNGTEAGQVQALVDTLRQVMRERDAARTETLGLSHALLLKGYRGYADQVNAMAQRIRELEAELAEARAEIEGRKP